MIDISILNSYIMDPDTAMISYVEHETKSIGVSVFLDNLLNSLDCSRKFDNGYHVIQTIGYPYIRFITEFIYTVNNYITDSNVENEYLTKLLELHNKNIEYEAINPPIWYGGEKAKRKFEKSKLVKSKPKTKKDPNKPSAAEKKLAAKVAKLNSLSLNIKPIIK